MPVSNVESTSFYINLDVVLDIYKDDVDTTLHSEDRDKVLTVFGICKLFTTNISEVPFVLLVVVKLPLANMLAIMLKF